MVDADDELLRGGGGRVKVGEGVMTERQTTSGHLLLEMRLFDRKLKDSKGRKTDGHRVTGHE
jgi:hypothetical protein